MKKKLKPIRNSAWLASLRRKFPLKRKYLVLSISLLLGFLAGGTVLAVYQSGRTGQAAFRQQAEEALRDVAESVVRRCFDGMNEPLFFVPDKCGKSVTTRVLVSANGRVEIKIDSLKESQSLYALEHTGLKAYFVNEFLGFPLEELEKDWRQQLSVTNAFSCLVLRHAPVGRDSVWVESAGDSSIVRSDFEVGTYYVDCFYSMTLTAYARADFWACVEWKKTKIGGMFLLFLLGCGSLWFLCRRRPLPPGAVLEDAMDAVWAMGKLVYDKDSMVLTCDGRKVDIQPQSLRLFCAFIKHDGFLYDEEINQAMGWDALALGMDKRRQMAVSTLRAFLSKTDSSIRIKRKDGGYAMFVES